MQDFDVLEKQADYFVARKRGMHCKIVLDDYSQDMPIGTHRLHVEEVSDRYTHRSNEGIFRLTLPFAQQGSIDICTMPAYGKYNLRAQKRYLQLGGKWEPVLEEWVFSASVKDKVAALSEQMNSQLYWVTCLFNETVTVMGEPLTLFGYPVVKGLNKKLNPILEYEVTLKQGEIAQMPGKAMVLAGSAIRLAVPEALLENSFFHEDFLCVVDISKRKKPNKRSK
jgi:hypothetical protein